MNIKRIALKLGLVSLLAFGANLNAAENSLRIGIEAAYPPFASKTPDNTIVGFDYDIGQALCAEMKVRCDWIEQEFDGLIPALKVKKVDAVISSMSITPERMKSVDFTNRYYRIPARLVFRKGSGISEIPSQLKGKRIGVQRATNFDRYGRRSNPLWFAERNLPRPAGRPPGRDDGQLGGDRRKLAQAPGRQGF